MPLNLFYTMVQKSQKWPKTQIKGGGPALSPTTNTETSFMMDVSKQGPCTLRHRIQNSMEAILACHPALSTKWLDWVAQWCERWCMMYRPHSQ